MLFLSACGTNEPEIFDNGQPGQIRVVVFHDENHNRVMDEGESGVSDEVAIGQGVSCPTGKGRDELLFAQISPEGSALYLGLVPGRCCVMYTGGAITTMKLNHWVYLDSEEEVEVLFGMTSNSPP